MAPNDAPSIDGLLNVEASLDRAFMVCVGAVAVEVAWLLYQFGLDLLHRPWTLPVNGLLLVSVLGTYVWLAVEVGRSATCLGRSGWPYSSWVIVAPPLALGFAVADLDHLASVLEMPPWLFKFAAALVAASPLSLTFVLGNELRSEIHSRTFAD